MANTIYTAARFLIGVRWDGRLTKFSASYIDNPAQFCVDRGWIQIDGVRRDWSRFVIYENRFPIITSVCGTPVPNPGPVPDWEKERIEKEKAWKKKEEEEQSSDYF